MTLHLITDAAFYAVAIPAALLVGVGKSGVAGGFGILAVPLISAGLLITGLKLSWDGLREPRDLSVLQVAAVARCPDERDVSAD